MYSGTDDTRFVRKRAGGGEFEFSDAGGKFIVIARMDDAGATFKPVLRLGLTPVDEQDLAADIKKQLGKAVSRADDMNVIKEMFSSVSLECTAGYGTQKRLWLLYCLHVVCSVQVAKALIKRSLYVPPCLRNI